LAALGAATPAAGDAFDPVALEVEAPAIARSDRPLSIAATVTADPGALTGTDGQVRIRVKLAPICGGSFEGTEGVTLVDRPLDPQPRAGAAYRATATGSGTPASAGEQAVCAFVAAGGDERQYAANVDATVDVSAACTTAARRVERQRRTTRRATKELRRARAARRHRRTARTLRRVRRARSAAIRAKRRLRRDVATGTSRCGGVLW